MDKQKIISWDEYFMGVAILASMRSKDPVTKAGVCIVNDRNRIVGTGYNGTPQGWDDDKFPWDTSLGKGQTGTAGNLDRKYPYVIHGEVNAILNSNTHDLRGCTLYVTYFPCNECAKVIAQSGISKVVYAFDRYYETETCIASRRIFDELKVKYEKIKTHANLVLEW